MRKRSSQTDSDLKLRSPGEAVKRAQSFTLRERWVGWCLLVLGVVGCGILTWISFRNLPGSRLAPLFVLTYGLLFGIYLFGLRWIRTLKAPDKSLFVVILSSGALLRAILLPGVPLLDDDIYRYRWDGKVLAHGRNPYAFPPESSEFAWLREGDPLFEKMGFRDVPAVYPPASQVVFTLGYAIDPGGVLGIKSLVMACDILSILAIMALLKAIGRPIRDSALYAWNPLVLKEFSNSGHHDAIGIALFVFGLYALVTNRRLLAVPCLGIATLVKPILIALSPGLWRQLKLKEWALWGAILICAYLPFAEIGPTRLFAGMRLYAQHWEMNDSLFALLQWAFGGPKAKFQFLDSHFRRIPSRV